MSQASATISRVMVPPADDDEATARSRMGRMASATLRRPIACSSVAAASRPSLVLGDSSELPMTTISRPGVWGSDVTGTRPAPPASSCLLAPRDSTPVALGLGVQPRRTGVTASAPALRPYRSDRPAVYSTRSVQPWSKAPDAGTFGPPVVPHRASLSASLGAPPPRHGRTVRFGPDLRSGR